MKAWAEKRKHEVEALGATELAEMFHLIIRLCELEEQTNTHAPNFMDAQLAQQSGPRPECVSI